MYKVTDREREGVRARAKGEKDSNDWNAKYLQLKKRVAFDINFKIMI